MTNHYDIVGATSFTYQPPDIESCGGAVNPKWVFYMRHGDNPAFRWAHLLMPGAVRDGVIYGVIPAEGDDNEESEDGLILGGQFYKCCLEAGGQFFETWIWARNTTELMKVCLHIGALRPDDGSYNITRWQRFKCVLRYFWLRRPTIKLRSPVQP